MKKNVIVGQSGGPTAVINSSLYGVVKQAAGMKEVGQVIGMVNGIEGFLKGKTYNFQEMIEDGRLEYLLNTPGAFLGSCRYKLPEDLSSPVYEEIIQKLEKMDVGYFCYIGGNDSMDTVSKLSRCPAAIGSEIRFMGVPKTVDNDLILTDHTPGFGSAAKYVAHTVKEISYDASVYDSKSVTIVEIMGRHAGWLTAASVLARECENDNPYLVYLPEAAFDVEKFISQVEEALESCPNLVVCVSEGIKDKNGVFICEYDSEAGVDSFGHKMLTGCGKYLEKLVRSQVQVKVRSIELNVCQRCSAVLMSETDQREAVMAGNFAVREAVAGESGKMAAFRRKVGNKYELECTLEDVNLICNQEKTVPAEWITKDGSDVGEEFIRYALPLIQGKVTIPVNHNGTAVFAKRK